ncbi:TetR/AcrR family transcriptional regulator [Antrihabitans stalactiti]|uniref:TetR/AcrR family transcriptional regulator n=1 Tax=Antrihabitans stalactiti TaxID=2584121 RepID=A0A848KGM9_9NOCA|nr:TetR/AcrR family transcriptional regulator [Antrihabitans stalactiti]NMN95077.1 TetR/AcrR family transcriptional regulator [Antrihabitans stalactiti]
MAVEDAAARRFVEAGLRILIDQPGSILDRGLRSEDVINSANGSHATFYRKFPSKSDFLAEVVDGLIPSGRYTPKQMRSLVLTEMSANGGLTRATVRALITSHFSAITDELTVTKRLLAQVLAVSTQRTTFALRADYQRRDQLVLAAFEASFGRLGATLRKPFTATTFATAMIAIVEGFMIRRRADPGSVTPALLADTILAVLSTIVDTAQLHEHVDDALASLDPQSSVPRTMARDPRSAVIVAARDEFSKRGYFMTRLETIASNASVPVETARMLFPTKSHILIGALKSRVSALTEAVADDLLIGVGTITIIENHLLRCAQLVADETAFMDALVAAVAHDTYSEPEGMISIKQQLNLPAIIAPVIQQGQDDGDFTDLGTPTEIAAGITNTLLLRCFTRRHLSPEENATFIGNLLLQGLRAR